MTNLKRRTIAPIADVRLDCLVQHIDTNPPRCEYRFAYNDIGGKQQRLDVSRSLLGQSRRIVEELLKHGCPAGGTGLEARVRVEIGMEAEVPIVQVTSRHGWLDGAFVSHARTFGGDGKAIELNCADTLAAGLRARLGSAALWREQLLKPCLRSQFLTFAIALAYAAPLIKLLGEQEGMLFQLTGESSTGKSLSARVCQSVFGRTQPKDIATFDTTPRRLEELCASRSDLVTIIDELGTASGGAQAVRDLQKAMAFMVAGGSGRGRSITVADKGLQGLSWRTIALCTAEQAPGSRIGGEEVRYMSIPVPPGEEGGIFDRLKDGETSAELARHVEAAIKANYGVPFDAFIDKLVEQRPKLKKEAAALRDEFVETHATDARPMIRRIAGKLGLVHAAAIIATRLGATPWQKESTASKAVAAIYQRILADMFDAHSEVDGLIKELQAAEKKALLRPIISTTNVKQQLEHRLWFCNDRRGVGPCIFLTPRLFEERWSKPGQRDQIVQELKRRGLLITDGRTGKNTVQYELVDASGMKHRPRLYCLKADAILPRRPTPKP